MKPIKKKRIHPDSLEGYHKADAYICDEADNIPDKTFDEFNIRKTRTQITKAAVNGTA